MHQRVTLAASELSVRPGQTVSLHGSVLPLRSGRVTLQRRGPDGGWDPVARARLDRGRWALSWRVASPRPTELRVRVAGRPGSGLAAGTSRVVTVG